jgi:Tol biopolymer transport system component
MADLHDRFRSLDRIAVPDLWADVEERAVAAAPKPLSRVGIPSLGHDWLERPRSRAWQYVLVLALLIVALLMLVLAVGGEPTVPTTPLVFNVQAGSGPPGLYAVDIASGRRQLIGETLGQRIHVSPDGRWALFEGTRFRGAISNMAKVLILARTDGSGAREVSDSEYELGREWESIWAPDSHAVAWLSWRIGEPSLMVADVAGGDPHEIVMPPGVDPHLVWSPDSVHVAYVDWAACESLESRHLYVVDTVAGTYQEVGDGLDLGSLPAWSHDGRHLAARVASGAVIDQGSPPDPNMCVGREGPQDIVIWTADTDQLRTMTMAFDIFNLAWSPDDAMVMGQSGQSVWGIPIDGAMVAELARLEPGGEAIWSPDAGRLAWTAWDGTSEETFSLWVTDVPGGESRRVARDVEGSGSGVWPKWSPDGAWIAFHRGGGFWIVRPDGSGERLLVDASLVPDRGGVDW